MNVISLICQISFDIDISKFIDDSRYSGNLSIHSICPDNLHVNEIYFFMAINYCED